MNIQPHNQSSDTKIAESTSETILITNVKTRSNIVADLYYEECDAIIVYEKNLAPTFFDLKTGIAGEKFYRNFRTIACDRSILLNR